MAEICDTPVPVSNCTAICGMPTEPGDEYFSEYIMLPKSFVGQRPLMFVNAEGDSMKDAGIEAGDKILIQLGVPANDGDTVVACIDNACTVKSLFTDADGQKWLVPQNQQYDPIPLNESMDVRIIGVVENIEKASPRASTQSMLRSIDAYKKKGHLLPQHPTSQALPQKESLDTSFFRVSEYRTHEDCMRHLLAILSSSDKKSAVCRQLFDEEGRKWFALYDYSAEKIASLLSQFPSKVEITKSSIEKAKAEVSVEVTKARTAKDRLSKYDL